MEAEFLDVIRTKVLRVFLLAIHSHLYKRILLPPSLCKNGLNWFVMYSRHCTRKPQFWELSKLCPETSTKLFVHKFGFWKDIEFAQSTVEQDFVPERGHPPLPSSFLFRGQRSRRSMVSLHLACWVGACWKYTWACKRPTQTLLGLTVI